MRGQDQTRLPKLGAFEEGDCRYGAAAASAANVPVEIDITGADKEANMNGLRPLRESDRFGSVGWHGYAVRRVF